MVFVSSGLMSRGRVPPADGDADGDAAWRAMAFDGRKGDPGSHAPTGYCDSKLAQALCCQVGG